MAAQAANLVFGGITSGISKTISATANITSNIANVVTLGAIGGSGKDEEVEQIEEAKVNFLVC